VYPGSLTVYYLPNALGQPTQAGTFATGVQYYPNGAIKRFTYGNGLVHTMAQNARQLPERSTDSGGVLDLGYAYDRNGNVSAITDFTVAGRQSRSMGYDARDRLTSASSLLYPGGATYTYDVLDNVTRATVAGRDHVYWYDANNRLTNVLNGPGGASIIGLGYDARGNVNNKNGNLFVFDYGNRLRTAGSGGLLYEMYSLDGKLLWQRDEQLGLRFQHIYLGGSLVASRRMPIGETVYGTIYRHTDALGSPIAATDELGNTLQTTEHEPYGKMLNRTNDNRPGYTGHMMDKATGLVYMQQRYYDPLIPRFLSVDPIAAGLGRNFNRYAYAANNPYRFTDPDGRDCKSKDGTTTCTIPVTGSRIPTKISFPTPPGVSGSQDRASPAYHRYVVPTSHNKSDHSVQNAMANDPTPGQDKPATPTGTPNNATPGGARGLMARSGAALGDDPRSPVKSYIARDRNGNTWTINVTQPGHGLHFGYVLRGSVNGTAITIGEGWAVPQVIPVLSEYINNVWVGHNQKNIDDAN